MRWPVLTWSCRLLTELASTKTPGLRHPASTPVSENAKCTALVQNHSCSVVTRPMRQSTIHSGSHAIVSRRFIINSFGSGPSQAGKPRMVSAERVSMHRRADQNRLGKKKLPSVPPCPAAVRMRDVSWRRGGRGAGHKGQRPRLGDAPGRTGGSPRAVRPDRLFRVPALRSGWLRRRRQPRSVAL